MPQCPSHGWAICSVCECSCDFSASGANQKPLPVHSAENWCFFIFLLLLFLPALRQLCMCVAGLGMLGECVVPALRSQDSFQELVFTWPCFKAGCLLVLRCVCSAVWTAVAGCCVPSPGYAVVTPRRAGYREICFHHIPFSCEAGPIFLIPVLPFLWVF